MVLQAIDYNPGSDSADASLKILDQLVLPHESVYLPITTCEDAFNAIKSMQVRGAPAIAIVAALALAVECQNHLKQREIPETATTASEKIGKRLEYLKTSRPTAVNLGDAVGKLKAIARTAASQPGADGRSVVHRYVAAAEQMLVDDVSDNKAIGKHGAKWIAENTKAGQLRLVNKSQDLQVLTHCNTGSLATAGYGTALGVIRSLRESDMLTHAYCSETRPYNQGSRLTAYELVHDRIPATLITDSMAAALIRQQGQNLAAIVVGADRVAANGDTANKIGTYSLAVLARHHGVKFLVTAPRTTIDRNTPSGSEVTIEQRSGDEVTRVRAPKIAPNGDIMVHEPETVSTAALGINVWNPAFDITPAELIDGIVTEVGVVEKSAGKFNFDNIFSAD